ncbi:MAG: TRL-like family protein [Proteobacteria bacterium]|jgi:hypothetical protein|nr:TRL-like family protein [Pseudomonadota bacterium]
MKKWEKILGLGFGLCFFMGCAMVQSPVMGFIYMDVKAPITADSGASASKEGTACASSILGWVATGDASIEAAMKNGGISKVATVDYNSTNILMIYAKFCTIVRGQ